MITSKPLFKKEKILIVGCGPGGIDYVTPVARMAVEEAEVLAGAEHLLDLFPENNAEKIVFKSNIKLFLDKVGACYSRKKMVVPVTGDPGIYSLASSVIKRFGLDTCEFIPGISSVQVAFAKLGMSWEDAKILSAHSAYPQIDSNSLNNYSKIAILAGRQNTFKWIADFASSLEGDRKVFLCENLTLSNEEISQLTILELEELKDRPRAIVLLIQPKFCIQMRSINDSAYSFI